MASCPDSDNSWVLAGSENLPVETLGPEPRMGPESEGTPQALWDPSKADGEELAGTLDGEETLSQTASSQNESTTLPEETKAKGALGSNGHEMEPPGGTAVQEDLQETPEVASLGPDTQDLEDESPPQDLPSSPKAVWKECHCSSSDDDTDADVEGLRRRRGREPSLHQPMIPVDVGEQARGEGVGAELGISLNMCFLGALVLLGLGILLFSGALLEPETGPMEEAELQVFPDTGPEKELVDTMGNRQEEIREQLEVSIPPDSIPSLQNMGLLLDKLAKENQDIRLLQAQLQAQKEELQSLLHQPKGLEEENAQLREALQQGKTSHQALESELQQLRARLQGLEANCVRGVDGVCLNWGRGSQGHKDTKEQGHKGQEPDPSLLEQHKRLEAEAQALRQELQRQWQLLGSVHRNLQRGLKDGGQGAPARADLAELGHMLAQTLQGLENWGHSTGANDSEAWHQKKSHSQNSREWSGKERWHGGQRDQKAEHWKHRKEESGRERKKSWRGEGRDPAGGWREDKSRAEELGNRKDGKRQDPKEYPRKSGHPHSGERQKHSWGKGNSPDPLSSWEELLRRKYRPPQGCSGVEDCARQEGLAYGVELAPVQRKELASVLRAYLSRLPWAGQLTKELPLSPEYFGEDGVFKHDRLRFRDFVDALEDSLEEMALKQMRDDDEVDDFEDFILSHFFGDKALKKRSRKKEKHSWNPRVMGPREEHSHHPHHYHHG